MEDSNYLEYLKKPIIEGIKYELTDEKLVISNENTCFLNVCNVDKFRQEDLLNLYKELLSLCRKNNVKVSYKNGYKKFIQNRWSDYVDMIRSYKKIYEEVKQKAFIVKKKGIRIGYGDDVYLMDMCKTSYKLNPYWYRDSVISQMNEVYSTLKRYLFEIKMTFNSENNIVDYKIFL